MNRYFYYNYLTVSFANLLVFVPYVLIQNRYNGTVLAIPIGFVIGIILLYLFTKTIKHYPNKDIFSIVKDTKQTWFIYLFVFAKTVIAIASSILVVGGYAVIVTRYLNPEGNLNMVLVIVLVAIGYAVTRNLLSVAYIIEFMMVVTIPFITFVMYKTFTNPIFNMDTVLAIGQHYRQMPNLLTVASVVFFFSGFTHLSLFALIRNKPIQFKYCWPAPLMSLIILLVTLAVPIGMLGSETAADYLFVWTVAADATQMPFGFIERLMFIFIIVLLSIAFTYTVSTLSQIIEAGKSMILLVSKRLKEKQVNRLPVYIYSVLAIVIFICVSYNNDFLFERVAKWYIVIHFVTEVVFTVAFYILVKWKGKKHDTTPT